ncbi:uncharacterized protein H6S33_003316 [Morchella sextelata]|uniref:uncharacterized protein n=1 Tax=Morchella sextelata TaxID=1174677 RepID=UPI001D049451|nr:uncharacterized protein H6S33_003316 [Morchella sextelata]KAH0607328.1 hypothetical protein H6S33_003316 [Morchella sextelata]
MSAPPTTPTPTATATATPDHPAPKRMRVSRACEQCRSRKAKCDGKTPGCSPCVTLSQTCTYGAQPRKRGLPPGSVSALERTVKLLQRVLGMLMDSVDGGEGALLALVKGRGATLFDEGEEGRRLVGLWKEGAVLKELERVRESVTGTATGAGAGTGTGTTGTGSVGERSPDAQDRGPQGEVQLQLVGGEHDAFRDTIRAMAEAQRSKDAPRRASMAATAATTTNGDATATTTTEMDWAKESQSLQQDPGVERGRDKPRDPPMPLLQHTPGTDHGSSTASSYPTRMRPPPVVTPPLYTPLDAADTADSADDHHHHHFSSAGHDSILPTPTHGTHGSSFRPRSYPPESPLRENLTGTSTATAPEHPPLPHNSRLLLDLYFAYTHVWFPILDKYDLVRFFHIVSTATATATSTKRKASPPPKADIPPGKRALLYAVLSLASLQHDALADGGSSSSTYGYAYAPTTAPPSAATLYTAAQAILFTPDADADADTTIEHIQALLLLALINLSHSHNHSAYLLIGHAGRLATTIGLPAALGRFGIRAWTGYLVLETLISTLTSYPAHIYSTFWIGIIDEDGWEEWDSWKEHPAAVAPAPPTAISRDSEDPAHILTTFNALANLARIVSRATHTLPDLHNWCRDLPPHCSFDVLNPLEVELPALVPSTPHVSHLHLFYAHAILALHDNAAATASIAAILEAFAETRSLAVAPPLFVGVAKRADAAWAGRLGVSGVLTGAGILKAPAPGRKGVVAAGRGAPPRRQEEFVEPSRVFNFTPPPPPPPPPQPQPQPQPQQQQPVGVGSLLSPRGGGGQEEEYGGGGGSQAASLSFSQPSPDGFDEEMGMLECLPWTQAGIPEFIQNLGYVGGFSPSAFQLPPESQAPLQILGLRQDTDATYSHPDENEMGAAAGRRGLNTVLEQWLGDVLGAGGVGGQGGGGQGGGQGGRWS